MKHFLLVTRKFYLNNGLLGISLKKINQLRAGDDNFGKIPHTQLSSEPPSSSSQNTLTSEQVDDILSDNRISDSQKKPFYKLRSDPMFGESKKVMNDKLYKNLIAKTKHPVYSRIKSKIPYAVLSPFTFSELSRLAT